MKSWGWTIPDEYRSRPSDLDTCPECDGPKSKHGSMCIACRRRVGRFSRPEAERFWEKVDATAGLFACWPWTGARDPHGYGRFMVRRGRSEKSSRVAYRLTHGAIPDRLYVLHTCDNPPCVNPAHLWLGTQADNMADMVAKGRHRSQRRIAA